MPKASKQVEPIHMSYLSIQSAFGEKLILLLSVTGYTENILGISVVREIGFKNVSKHISDLLIRVEQSQNSEKPLFIMSYGKQMMEDLQNCFSGGKFIFDPVQADKIVMPVGKILIDKLFSKL